MCNTPCLHPADRWTHCPYDEESDDEHQEDRPKPDQHPHACHDEDKFDHRRRRYLEAHNTRFLFREGLVLGEWRNVKLTGLDFSFHIHFLLITVSASGVTVHTSTNFSTRFLLRLKKTGCPESHSLSKISAPSFVVIVFMKGFLSMIKSGCRGVVLCFLAVLPQYFCEWRSLPKVLQFFPLLILLNVH